MVTTPEQKIIDTANRFAVGIKGEHVVTLIQVPQILTVEDAMNLAAYIVAVTGCVEDFIDLLNAVEQA